MEYCLQEIYRFQAGLGLSNQVFGTGLTLKGRIPRLNELFLRDRTINSCLTLKPAPSVASKLWLVS